jgi:hypothetical protein
MNPHPTEELHEFHHFLGEKLNNGGARLSPEEALDEWRRLRPDTTVADDDLAAIQEALDDRACGDGGVPFEAFDRAFRERHQLPNRP